MDKRGAVRAVCLSARKGTPKTPAAAAELVADSGLKDDAHAGPGPRQVSILSFEEAEKFRLAGSGAGPGAFGENLLVEGIDFAELPPGTRFAAGEALLETTRIGKKCHSRCAIYKRTGRCIMPDRGVFARVLKGGIVRPGDAVVLTEAPEWRFTAAVVVLSDRGFRGEREDLTGPLVKNILLNAGYRVVSAALLPDDRPAIERELVRLCDELGVNLAVTAGGTGFSPRDVTPEATLAVGERNVPGLPELMRAESLRITPRAALSRAAAVIRGRTLIVNLPGSVKGAEECLGFILDTLGHGLDILLGRDGECGRKD